MSGAAIQHTEVWDDSALVNSWNEAFEEYKVCGLSVQLKLASSNSKAEIP